MSVLNRRDFMVAAGATTLVMSGSSSSAANSVTEAIERKDVRDLSADEVDRYREAIRRMKSRGPARPSWTGATRTMPSSTGQDKQGYAFQALLHTGHCPHGNWWFFPWHRVYLYNFEQILRQLVADYKPSVPLAIPYWDWTDSPTVPTIFTGDMSTNSLADNRRFSRTLSSGDVGTTVIHNTLDLAGSFRSFGSQAFCSKRSSGQFSASQFEAGPHGIVHVKIGWFDSQVSATWPNGRPGTFRDPVTAAFDPIFWSHHANIDRLWNRWLSQTGHSNPSFNEPCPGGTINWGSLVLNEFVDGNGNALSRTVQEFLTDPGIKGVTYKPHGASPSFVPLLTNLEASPMTQDHNLDETSSDGVALPQLELGRATTLTVIPHKSVNARIQALFAENETPAELVFRVEGLQIGPEHGALMVRAFLNKADASSTTSIDDPHYVGYFTFFGADHVHQESDAHSHAEHVEGAIHASEGASFMLNLAPAIRALGKEFNPEAPVSVSLVLMSIDESKENSPPEKGQMSFRSGRLMLSE